jgi:hypothetical protein
LQIKLGFAASQTFKEIKSPFYIYRVSMGRTVTPLVAHDSDTNNILSTQFGIQN